MACGARSGLKPRTISPITAYQYRLNGLWSPFGIETVFIVGLVDVKPTAKWLVELVRD